MWTTTKFAKTVSGHLPSKTKNDDYASYNLQQEESLAPINSASNDQTSLPVSTSEDFSTVVARTPIQVLQSNAQTTNTGAIVTLYQL